MWRDVGHVSRRTREHGRLTAYILCPVLPEPHYRAVPKFADTPPGPAEFFDPSICSRYYMIAYTRILESKWSQTEMALSPETAPQDRPPEEISAFLSSCVAPSASEIRRQLARILSSSAFEHAERLSRFLRFVVEETLEGRDEQIKGYVLALEVFDRPDSFDPRLDSIVRVEACRLRAKIKSYYENDGQNDPVVIQILPGSYIPTFRTRERSGEPRETDQSQGSRGASRPHWKIPAVLLLLLIGLALGGIFVHIGGLYQENSGQAEERGQSSQPDLSSVAVLPFLDLSRERNLEYLCHGIAQEIISVLTRVPGLRVASLTSAFRFQVGREDVRTIGQNPEIF